MLSERAASHTLRRLCQEPLYAPVVNLQNDPGVGVFVVGGAVRDVLLGRPIRDLDFVVTGLPPTQLERTLRRAGKVSLVGKRFGVLIFRPRGAATSLDIALPRVEQPSGRGGYRDVAVRSDSKLPIEQDLARRDFTINAIAFDCASGRLIDPQRGLPDLDSGVVRTIGEPARRFAEDYSRMMRAIRFAVQLDARLEPHTAQTIKRLAFKLNEQDERGRLVSDQLIGRELGRALHSQAHQTLRLLDQTNLLDEVLPEVARLKGIEQSAVYHPEGDAFVHTQQALERLYAVSDHPSLTESLAVMLHDIGKAKCVQVRDLSSGTQINVPHPHSFFTSPHYQPSRQRVTNIGHAGKGARLAASLIKRLALAQFEQDDEIDFSARDVLHNIEHHLLLNIDAMRPSKAEPILFYPDGRVRWSLLSLVKADERPGSGRYESALGRVQHLLKQKLDQSAAQRLADALISGNDVLDLGEEPGPRVGAVLSAVRDAQLAGTVSSRQAALSLARSYLRRVKT